MDPTSPSAPRLASMDPRYLERRAEFESRFSRAKVIPESRTTSLSPCLRYRIDVEEYATEAGRLGYSRGTVTRCSNGEVLADVRRNYPEFWHAWVIRSDGQYLLFGEDYQGYSVLNLADGAHETYFPEAAYGGAGFCCAQATPSPDGRTVAVEGCVWACPFQLALLDVSDAMTLPLRTLALIDDLVHVNGWLDSQTLSYATYGPQPSEDVDGPVIDGTWTRVD